jgi:hypothetical protein
MILYMDMDGVLANFVGGVCKVFGWDEKSLLANWPPVDWNYMGTLSGLSEDDFWDRIKRTPDFWLLLEPYLWRRQLLSVCGKLFTQMYLVTCPQWSDPGCIIGKIAWIEKYTPFDRHHLIFMANKYLLACLKMNR